MRLHGLIAGGLALRRTGKGAGGRAGNYFDFLQPGWKKLAWVRAGLCADIMRGGLDVVWSDVDVVWFQSPFPLLDQHPEVRRPPPSHLPVMLPPAATPLLDFS